MTSTKAWQRHGCYHLGSEQFYNAALNKALIGCRDDRNSLDHFDPTTDSRRLFSQFFYLRSVYPALQDGFALVQRGNWTYMVDLPGSNGTGTETGLWSVSRGALSPSQNFTGAHATTQVWLLFTNVNATQTWQYPCDSSSWISSPFQAGTTIRNLFYPYESFILAPSLSPYFMNGQPPYIGCLGNITMDPMSFKAFVPDTEWVPPLPAITKFIPGHDARILAEPGTANATTVDITFEFSTAMDCNSVTQGIAFNMSSSGHGGNPTILPSSVVCATINPSQVPPSVISGVAVSAWSWSATLQNVPDGILEIVVSNVTNQGGSLGTMVSLPFLHVCTFFNIS
jgi:alpha-1,3-glucan synthase